MADEKRRLRLGLGVPDPGNRRAPPVWNPDLWVPTKGTALVHWLPDNEFDVMAARNGIDNDRDGFAVPRRWWTRHPHIYMRARMLSVFPHEARHAEDFLAGRKSFHT